MKCLVQVYPHGEGHMVALTIKWQRLVDEKGNTCQRCRATETEVEKGLGKLREALLPLGINAEVEKVTLDVSTFRRKPAESNRIWVSGRPLEEWLQAHVGLNKCCDVCGDAHCRTVTVDDRTYEVIPAELVIRAGLMAASELVGEHSSCCHPDGSAVVDSCCPDPPYE